MKDWRPYQYNYGYLMTNSCAEHTLLHGWNKVSVASLSVWTHPKQKVYLTERSGRTFVLIGHAYNPFAMMSDETAILERLAEACDDERLYRERFDELTGVFFYCVIEGDSIVAACDCAGMMGAYYAETDGKLYYSSHCQLIADIVGLKEDPYVTKLKRSRFFRLYGWYLPADLSSYRSVKRILPNVEVIYDGAFKLNRFYPREKYSEMGDEDYSKAVERIGGIIHNNLELIAKKWRIPAISMTGGTDSKTTLACANGIQEKFGYFSYISLDREAVDAEAAHKICAALGLEHTTFVIPEERSCYPEYDTVSELIERHYGFLGKGNDNDIKKRIYLESRFNYDIEVKSWVSEIARASRYGKYNKTKLPDRMSARRLTSMYKIFLFNRGDAIRTDRIFKEYMLTTQLEAAIERFGYPWSEFFVWENVFGGWGGLALTGEHKLSNDITVPYNNRALLDLMLRTPLQKRMTDQLHRDIIRHMDMRIEELGIHVVNGNETKKRAVLEGLYFDINTHLPL